MPSGFDIFSEVFDADGTSIDAVLDALDIEIDVNDPSNITISICNEVAFSFDVDISIDGFDIVSGGSDASDGDSDSSDDGSDVSDGETDGDADVDIENLSLVMGVAGD